MSDYETDIAEWAEQRATLLRRRAAGALVNDAEVDWSNVAEEIESVGRSERSALRSHIATVLEHLIKLQASAAKEPRNGPRNGWKETVVRARDDIDRVLIDSPSLCRLVAETIAEEIQRSGRQVARSLALYSEQPLVDVHSLTFTEDQVLGEWLP